MAHLRHVSIFHLVASGGCTVEIANGDRREVLPATCCSCRLPTSTGSERHAAEIAYARTSFAPARSKAC